MAYILIVEDDATLRELYAAALHDRGHEVSLAETVGGALPVQVELSGDLTALKPSVEAALFRLAQESVTNALKHARRATRVQVKVVGERERVRLTVCDDGQPGPPRPTQGFGLVGMAERVALLGGTFKAGPAPGQGWTVEAVLPGRGVS